MTNEKDRQATSKNQRPKISEKIKEFFSHPMLYFAKHDGVYLFLKTFFGMAFNVLALSLGTNLLANLYGSLNSKFERTSFWIVSILVVLVIAIVMFIIDQKIIKARKSLQKNEEMKESITKFAVKSLGSDDTTEQEKILSEVQEGNFNEKLVRNCKKNIRSIVEACYASIQKYYSAEQSKRGENILDDNFKLTVNFMTESYHITYKENKETRPAIVIAAWKNFNDKQPRGMLQLDKNPKYYIYGNPDANTEEEKGKSEPYKMYEDSRAGKDIKIRINETTKDIIMQEEDRTKFQSSIVAPVSTNSNELIGVLVIHCNKEGFFSTNDEVFLSNIMNVFTAGIKKEKLILDAIYKISKKEDVERYKMF